MWPTGPCAWGRLWQDKSAVAVLHDRLHLGFLREKGAFWASLVSFRCSCLGKINLGNLSREAPLGEDVAKGADTWLGTDTLVRADGGREEATGLLGESADDSSLQLLESAASQ